MDTDGGLVRDLELIGLKDEFLKIIGIKKFISGGFLWYLCEVFMVYQYVLA